MKLFEKCLLCILFIVSYFSKSANSANILFYFHGVNFSQKYAVWPLVLSLADNGHNITFLSPQVKSPTPHKNITDLAPKLLQDMVSPLYNLDRFAEREASREKDFDYVGATIMICRRVIEARHSDPTLQQLFSADSKFDLVIVNSLLSECGFFVAKYFNAKTIHFTPGTVVPFFHETYGVPSEAAWIPDFVYKFENIPMSYTDRLFNSFMPLYWQWVRSTKISPALEDIAKPLLGMKKMPSLHDLESNVSLVLLNSHMTTDFARSLPPLFVDVGGMANWETEKEIQKQFSDFMEPSADDNEGVVLITFGSTVLLNEVSEKHQVMFFKFVERFPKVKFLMRWKGSLPAFVKEMPKNLMLSEWLPQREILHHPNMRAFITHGGISSIHEATYYGVPLIVLPLFADQDYNAYRVEAQRVGLRVEIRGMTAETLINALRNILTDERFKANMKMKSEIFRDRAQSPVETARFWTEFALRHNNTISTMRPGNQHLNPLQIRLLDVYLFCFVFFTVILFIIFRLLNCIVCRICGIGTKKDSFLKSKVE